MVLFFYVDMGGGSVEQPSLRPCLMSYGGVQEIIHVALGIMMLIKYVSIMINPKGTNTKEDLDIETNSWIPKD